MDIKWRSWWRRELALRCSETDSFGFGLVKSAQVGRHGARFAFAAVHEEELLVRGRDLGPYSTADTEKVVQSAGIATGAQ